MKKFLLKLLVFVSPIIILLYGLDVFISKNLAKSNSGDNIYWKPIFKGTVDADIVIYGSSRATEIIDPKILSDSLKQSAYNMGIYAHNFWLQYLRHRLILKYNKKPQLIIHSLDFLTFQKRADLFDPGQFLPYMLFDTLVKKYTISYRGYNVFDYDVPLVRYYGQLNYIHQAFSIFTAKTPDVPDPNKGYFPNTQQSFTVFTDWLTKRKQYEIEFDKPSLQLFDKYLAECQKDNIRVVFVYAPEYIDGQRYIGNRKQLFDIIHQFSKKYNIPLYDYSNDTMSYKKAYFYNSEHLNKMGSQLFTKKFAGDLKHNNSDVLKF
jgi:hypothetical protein